MHAAAHKLEIDTTRLHSTLEHLATFTHAEPSPDGAAVTRVVFTPDDLAARAWLKSVATEAGLSIREDAVGNTFFRLEGTDPSLAAVATGSHIDAIPHAGMYDGTVGVLGGLEALRAIQASGLRPTRAIELILFTSEEPTRFGIGCLGSRLLSGTLQPERAEALIDLQDDAGEKTLAQVRNEAGFHGMLNSVQLTPGHYKAFLELHIEQGPLLERDAQHIGLVTSIAAPAGYRFKIEGKGGHAGALLMPDRRDALCAAAELILSVEKHARATGSIDTVATVGTCAVHPGAVNSVPSRVTLQLDIRDTDAARRESVMHAIRSDIESIKKTRGVSIEENTVNADAPATCDAALLQTLGELCAAQNIAYRSMVSRAYHDTLFMAAIAPIAMIFIPCRNGVSHRPDEFATPADIARGALLLAQCLARLASD
jgi:N-carbamoyl-L-amino-acid hydrolase